MPSETELDQLPNVGDSEVTYEDGSHPDHTCNFGWECDEFTGDLIR